MGTTGLAMRQHAALSGHFFALSQHAVHCAAPPARNPSPEPRAMAPGEGSRPDAFLAAYEAAQALAARLPKSPPRQSAAALLAQVHEARGRPASGPGMPRVLFRGGGGGGGARGAGMRALLRASCDPLPGWLFLEKETRVHPECCRRTAL